VINHQLGKLIVVNQYYFLLNATHISIALTLANLLT
jgi:hypothetical protein